MVIGGYESGQPLHTDEEIDNAALDFVFSSNMHHMGTARMHRSPSQGVVDENCRVHDVKNLFIGGSAVFPTSSFACAELAMPGSCSTIQRSPWRAMNGSETPN